MDSALERQSHRVNLVEQKRLEKYMKLLTNNQKTVAMEIQKSQREVKRRLQRYRDRQRDLLGEQISGPALTVEDILKKHQPRLVSHTSQIQHKKPRTRPVTAPPPKIDMSMFLDLRKSKVDLRPMTASSRRQEVLQSLDARKFSASSGYRPITGERLGPADMESRYFVEEELDERSAFYNDLIEWRKRNELAHFRDINKKVMTFCGISPKRSISSAKTMWKSMGMVLKFSSLAANKRTHSAPPAPPTLTQFRGRKSLVKSPSLRESSPVESKVAWTTENRIRVNSPPRKFFHEYSQSTASRIRPVSAFM